MNQFKRWLIWLSRIHHCRGFGIQSPSDYSFVRYVVNEHWPYYAYEELTDDDWLTQKLGRLYFRLANWRQPKYMKPDAYQRYWHTGCKAIAFVDDPPIVELSRIDVEDKALWTSILSRCNERSVVVVEGIWRHPEQWQAIIHDERISVSFDLYYCGIVLFDKKLYTKHYIINY